MNKIYEKLLRCYESVQKKFDFTKLYQENIEFF